MLQSLHIRNLALVAALDVEFGNGLNAVTGETGAGKSLILGALQYLFGDRADTSVVRKGADRCEIAACLCISEQFGQLRNEVNQLLDTFGAAPCEGGSLLLKRLIAGNGSRAFINNTPVTLQCLRELGELLVDMHGPHEHQSLIRPAHQRRLLDAFAALQDDVESCRNCYRLCRQKTEELEKLRNQQSNLQEISFLEQQLKEIDMAQLDLEADADIEKQYQRASRARELIVLAQQCCEGLTETEGAITEQLSRFVHLLEELASIDIDDGPIFLERLEQVTCNLQELTFDLSRYAENQDLDSEELQRLESRINLIQKLKRRHGPEISDIINAGEALRKKLDAMQDHDRDIAELEQTLESLTAEHLRQCKTLTEKRNAAAAELATAIAGKLKRLDFAQAAFKIELEPTEPAAEGADRIQFIFAPNPGEPFRPLREVASSGEMSRVMLAIKTVLNMADNVPILIFDEVDANIGGRVAVTVAEELQAVARRHQVFSITHLPQIAAAGHQHFTVSKEVVDGRTVTTMTPLADGQRHEEIVRMLGASKDSESAVRHAREMLDKFKKTD